MENLFNQLTSSKIVPDARQIGIIIAAFSYWPTYRNITLNVQKFKDRINDAFNSIRSGKKVKCICDKQGSFVTFLKEDKKRI
jgi:hypothetical protein